MLAATLDTGTGSLIQTSRTVVIGLGEFGLQTIGLLLPRLEVYYRFVDPAPHPQIRVRLGLLYHDSGASLYYILDRSPSAFANTREIQELVLRPPPSVWPSGAKLLRLIAPEPAGQPASLHAWLDGLVRSMLSDSLSYGESIAHLNLYILVAARETYAGDLETLIDELVRIRRPTITVNLIGYLDLPLAADDRIEAQTAEFLVQAARLADGGKRIQHIYLLDRSKQNLAVTDSPGEVALAACNFLEQLVLSRLGDELTERVLPDVATLAAQAPYSSFGAAKLYVPIAEIASELLEQIAAEQLQRQIRRQPEGQADHLSARIDDLIDLQKLCRVILSDMPITLAPPPAWWRVKWQELVWRLRGETHSPHAARERRLRWLPRFRVDRRYWREWLAAYGRRRTPEVWWRALCAFERHLLEQALPETTRHGAQRLGIRLADERLVATLRIPTTPIAGAFFEGSPQERARSLTAWIAQNYPELQPRLNMIGAEAEARIFANPAITRQDLLQSLSTWMGHRLWTDQPPTGQLGTFYRDIRRNIAQLLADSLAWTGPLAQMLREKRALVARTEEILNAWNEAETLHPIRETLELQALRMQDAQDRLIRAMDAQPYPAALMTRLAILWILPIFLLLLAVRAGIALPPPWAERLPMLVIGYTVAMILLYVVALGGAILRRQYAQRRLERLIFSHVCRVFEHRVYAVADGTTPDQRNAASPSPPDGESLRPGLIPAFLQAFKRLLLDDPPPDPQLPASLYAVLDGTHQELAAGPGAPTPPRIESMLYHSIGDTITRELLATSLRQQLEQHDIRPRMDAGTLDAHLESPAMLSGYVRQTLKTQLGQEYTATVRLTDELCLHNVLALPEHRQINIQQLIDDLQLRAKPLLSTSQGAAQQVQSRETLHYLSASRQLQQACPVQETGLSFNAVRDPYGIGYVTLVYGLPTEALPIRIAAARQP